MTPITEKMVFHTPSLVRYEAAGLPLFLDPESPNWVSLEPRAADLLTRADGATPFGRIVVDYAAAHGPEAGKAWLHVHDFFREARRAGIVSEAPSGARRMRAGSLTGSRGAFRSSGSTPTTPA